ncbi:collagen-like protein [Arundinibacter roseus]|uniref:collagen-like protein n=1 Tax=Arundinibacter roseus TaxID=2070510 RepID=UPI0014050320|nr:collagen-like protein [Arundinibacter roseus]
MTKQLLLGSLVAILFACMSACEGPQGPVGPAGDPGSQGPAGEQGPTGATGTANVIYSPWARAGSWTATDLYGVNRFYVDISAPRLSQEVLDRGAILVYVKLTTENNQVRQLPVTVYAQFTEELLDFSLVVNRIRVWSTPIKPPIAPSPNNEFRYVLIPGGLAGRINYEKLSYEEAKEMFGFED